MRVTYVVKSTTYENCIPPVLSYDTAMSETDVPAVEVLKAVTRAVASQTFQGAGRSGALLRYLVDQTLAGRGDQLKEYTLGADALGRGPDFDPKNDSIARVEASRLRSRLDLYYATEGREDAIQILIPKGGYVPRFRVRVESPPVRQGANRVWMLAIGGLTAMALATVLFWLGARKPAEAPTLHLEVDLGSEVVLRSTQVGSSSVVLSPDGLMLAFVSFDRQVPRLMRKRLGGDSRPQVLAGTEGARGPFFSPDSKWLGYWAGGRLWKVSADGGTPTALCKAPDLLGASWGEDDTIVAAISTWGLIRIPANGGKVEGIAGIPQDVGPRWPQVLPGAKSLLFTAGGPAAGPPRIMTYSIAERKSKELGITGGHARYLRSGHIAWVDHGNLMIAPFDRGRLELTAKPIVYEGNIATGMYSSAEFDVSDTGTLIYRQSAGSRSIVRILDATDKSTNIISEPAEYSWPRVSPDGRRLSLLVGKIEQREAVELRVIDLATGRLVKSLAGVVTSSPVWSPDGRFLVFPKIGGGLDYITAEGTDGPKALLVAEGLQIPWSFGKDRLAYFQRGMTKDTPMTFDLWTLPIRMNAGGISSGKPEPFIVSDSFELFPAFSPDGHWVAFTSFESGAYEINVRPFPDNGRQWRISGNGGIVATWSPDANTLFYQTVEGHIMSLDWSATGGEFHSSVPRRWGKSMVGDTGVFPNINAISKGRVIALTPEPGTRVYDGHHVTFVVNLPVELKGRF